MIRQLLLALLISGTCATVALAGGDILLQTSFQVELDDCSATAPLCIDLSPQQLSNIGILHNGVPYAGGRTGCNFQTRFNYSLIGLFEGQVGTFSLSSWRIDDRVISGMFANVEELVSILNDNDPTGTWAADGEMIMGGNPDSSYGPLMISLPDNTSAQVAPAMTQIPQGTVLNFGLGVHQVVLADMMNSCLDTFVVTAICTPTTTTYEDTLRTNDEALVICLDTTELAGTVDTIFNDCPSRGGEFSTVVIDEARYCVKLRASKGGGIDTACIVICDNLGICDTTEVVITTETATAYQTDTIVRTVVIHQMDNYCVDTTELAATVIGMQNICPLASGTHAEVTFDSERYCIEYEGFELGRDTVCIMLRDSEGGQDTTIVWVDVILPPTDSVFVTIEEGEEDIFCVEDSELSGNITSFDNVCVEASGTAVDFGINNVTLCTSFDGIGIGTEQACLVLCDALGICDTTILTVTVVPSTNNNLPVAMDDEATAPLNTPTTIDILSNDLIPGSILTEQSLVTAAQHGVASINPNGTLSYESVGAFCGMDSVQYVICNVFGCDTATVRIDIGCFSGEPDEFRFYTGFSPNGDSINDTFTIQNVDAFPNNELHIYNRWGTEVFSMSGYDNGWDGTFNGQQLPDGTYFYQFILDDAREFIGWFVISR